MWFWPGETWDHHKLVFETNRHLHEILGLTSQPWIGMVGGMAVGLYFLVAGWICHRFLVWNDFTRRIYAQMTLTQYLIFQFFMTTMISLPVKMALKLLFRIKYVMVTPWFNI